MDSVLQYVQILGVILVAFELFILIAEARKTRDSNRKISTLDYMTAHFDAYNSFRGWLLSFPPERLRRPEELTDEEIGKIREYLTMLERLSVGVGQGMFSFDYISNVTNKSIRRNYVLLRPYILRSRHIAKSPRVFDAFEWLCFELDREAAKDEKILPVEWSCNDAFKPTKDFLRIHAR